MTCGKTACLVLQVHVRQRKAHAIQDGAIEGVQVAEGAVQCSQRARQRSLHIAIPVLELGCQLLLQHALQVPPALRAGLAAHHRRQHMMLVRLQQQRGCQ